MRAASMAAAVVFALFAALQVNDPDALVWVAIYGYALGVSLLAVFGKVGWWPLPGLLSYGAGFACLAPAIDANWWHSEEAREALGLLIAGLWMAALLAVRFRARSAAPIRG